MKKNKIYHEAHKEHKRAQRILSELGVLESWWYNFLYLKQKKTVMTFLILGILSFTAQSVFSNVVVVHPEKKALSLNGSFSVGPSYTWIDKPENAVSLYEGWENKLNIFIMGTTPKTNITGSGIFVFPYEEDEENKFKTEFIHLNLNAPKYNLTLGNSISNVSEASVYNLRLRGAKLTTSLLNSKIELFGGRTDEAEEADSQASGAYAQYTGGIRLSRPINPAYTLGMTLLSSSDDKGSISSPGQVYPLSNSLLGLDINYSPYKNLGIVGEYLKSWHDENKSDDEKSKRDDAYKIQAKGRFKGAHLKAGYKRIGANYYTVGNPYLLTDYQGADLKVEYPFKDIYTVGAGYETYEDNLDGDDSFTRRTKVLDLSFKVAPSRLPRFTFGYKQRSITSNKVEVETGKKEYDDQRKTISAGLMGRLKKVNWNLNIYKTYLIDDSKYSSGYQKQDDREFLTGSLSLSSQFLKNRLDLMTTLSDRIFKNVTTGEKEETFYSILRLRYKLIPPKLNFLTHGSYTANVDDGLKPEETEMGLGLDYYLSSRQSFSFACKHKSNREEDKYQANTVEVKYTRVF